MILDDKQIDNWSEIRKQYKKVVFTNGCFDILHAGHVRYLEGAKALGDCLVVGLNSDASVQMLKGPSRPINSQEDRIEVINGLRAVDYVMIFTEQTAENLIAKLRPDIYAKGGDYSIETLPEAKVILGYGGKIEFVPFVEGRSSTKIINKINLVEKQ